MISPSATRNQRCKGLKVKHVLQICAMLALCIWMLHQFRNTYDKNGNFGVVQNVMSEYGAMKLGRKDLDPRVPAENNESGEVEAEGEESEEVEDLIDEEDTDKETESVDDVE